MPLMSHDPPWFRHTVLYLYGSIIGSLSNMLKWYSTINSDLEGDSLYHKLIIKRRSNVVFIECYQMHLTSSIAQRTLFFQQNSIKTRFCLSFSIFFACALSEERYSLPVTYLHLEKGRKCLHNLRVEKNVSFTPERSVPP